MTLAYTDEQKANITHRLKAVCVALCEYWDALREVEQANPGMGIITDYGMIDFLASEFMTPPSFSDLGDALVWDTFLEMSKVEGGTK